MAAARAQAKGGVSGIHIWLIVFVALWLTSTVLLVLLYTDQKDLVLTNEELRTDVDSTRAQLRAAEQACATMADAATGEPDDSPGIVQSKFEALCTQIADDAIVPDASSFQQMSSLQVLTTLYEAFRGEAEKLNQALGRNRELGEQVETLASDNNEQKTAFDEQIADLGRRLSELETSWEDYAKTRDQEVDEFDEKLAKLDTDFNRDIQEQRAETKRVVANFDELQNRHGELQERLGELQIRPQELITARQADGLVVTAKPGEEVVYVDLGRDAGLVLGLQFAIYSAASGIPADGRAKARIEVANIFPSASECRIVEVHGREPILEGDLVANPVFDPGRSLRFVVVGRFDMDGDGQVDAEGARQIESLVQNWGGTVTQELSARIDFLVVGGAPPKAFIAGDPTPEARARYERAKKRYDDYGETLETAQSLSIPILTQSVFMHFLGYAT